MSQSVLLLGTGFVARPAVEYLSNAGFPVVVASRTLSSAEDIAKDFSNVKGISLDVNDSAALEAEVAKHALTVSLIPYTSHVAVIKAAIKAKKHVVTTSYISPGMQELHEEAKAAGITVMNEIGLDPGIDHLYAVDFIDRTHKEGGKIKSFRSFCTGAPAPEFSDNPLGYKFSWSPRGVLLAARNTAKFLQDGQVVEISGADLMDSAKPYYTGFQGYDFVAYGNRDSSGYRERYGIPEAQSVVRGTLRYGGFPPLIKTLTAVGFLSDDEQAFLKQPIAWKDATQKIIGAASPSENDLVATIAAKASFKSEDQKKQVISGLKWLGLFSDAPITPRGTPLDILTAVLEKKLAFEQGERDLVFLQHQFVVENKDGSEHTVASTLIEYGAPIGSGRPSAMARLVGTPCGVAVKQVLNGTISERGILAPLTPELIGPLMKELKDDFGIECKEKILG